MMWCTMAVIARPALHRLDPFVLGPAGIDDKPLILDRPFGRDLYGSSAMYMI